MESYINLTTIEKTKHKYFNFYLNLLSDEKDKNYINNTFNVPKLPLIGCKNENNNKNDKNSHILGKILSLVSFQIDICQGKEKNEIDQMFSDFVLPHNLNEYLNIDDVIEIDNNTDEPDVNLFFMPKHKLNFYFIISELPFYPTKNESKCIIINNKTSNKNENENKNIINEHDNNDDEIFDFFNENKKDNNKNKINIINDNEDKDVKDIRDEEWDEYEEIEDNKNNKFDIEGQVYNDINYDDFLIYNLIPHFFYINDNEKNLLEIKNLLFNEQITLFTIDNKNYYDIDNSKDKKFMAINNLRGETSNIILNDKGNFKIQPDNLQFYLNVNKKEMSQFYIIYTNSQNEYHSVFYYITCNNVETKNKIKNILNESMTLKDLITKIENKYRKNNYDIVSNLKKIFCNK